MSGIKNHIMEFLKMKLDYTSGDGDWLFQEEDDKKRRILDLVGSYGINLLGHNSKEIKQAAEEFLTTETPSMIQLSENNYIGKLEIIVNDELLDPGSNSRWNVLLTNTGTETVETAIKLARLKFEDKRTRTLQLIYTSINLIEWSLQNNCTDSLAEAMHALSVHSVDELKEILISQIKMLEKPPRIVHVERSFHGKTMGSLSVTDNKYYQSPWVDNESGIALSTQKSVKSQTEDLYLQIAYIDHRSRKLRFQKYTNAFACIFEAVQGEGGARRLSYAWLNELASWSKKNGVTLISDEIQCGLYRCGHFSVAKHLNLNPDIFCFGKSLGGGLTKVGMVTYRHDSTNNEFSIKHTSSFAGDKFSSSIALSALKTIKNNLEQLSKASNKLDGTLNYLKDLYPEYIDNISGMGLLRGVSLNHELIVNNHTAKFFGDLDLQGYWISSVLLNKENIRILPTLSSPNTFRIQPSIHFGVEESKQTIRGFSNLFKALKIQDNEYLFDHLSSVEKDSELNLISQAVRENKPAKHSAFFICHPVDVYHIRQIIGLTKGISTNDLKAELNDISQIQKYTVYHDDHLRNIYGEKTNVTFLGIPLISETFYQNLRSGDKHKLVKQIQEAVDFANEHEASIIGLGQFTSIVTNNGLSIVSKAPITTGNSYTVWLTWQAILNEGQKKNLQINETSIGVIGPCGNILSVLTKMLSEKVGRIILVHREGIERSKKMQHTLINLLNYVYGSAPENGFSLGLHRIINEVEYISSQNIWDVLNHKDISQYLVVTDDIYSVQECQIVLVGTNSPKPILFPEHVKFSSIIIDISVPANVSDLVWKDPRYTCLSGGMAALPIIDGKTQKLESVILPFEEGQCYACMAETFGLAMSKKDKRSYIGDLTVEQVRQIGEIMTEQGFHLHSSKLQASL